LLSFATGAKAQSTASFPVTSTPSAGPPAAPPSAAPAPSAAQAPSAPVAPSAPPSVSGGSAGEATTDSRYPLVAGPTRAPSAGTSGLGFYPALLPYRQGLPIPPGYRVEHRSANGLIAAGLASFLAAYGAALIAGAGSGFDDGGGWLIVPVIGPLATIGARSYHCDNDPTHANKCISGAFSEVQTIAVLSADAVVQATGAVLFLAGLGSGRDELVRSDVQARVRLTPRIVGTTGFGLGFDGRF
jgi:hypothetical protein